MLTPCGASVNTPPRVVRTFGPPPPAPPPEEDDGNAPWEACEREDEAARRSFSYISEKRMKARERSLKIYNRESDTYSPLPPPRSQSIRHPLTLPNLTLSISSTLPIPLPIMMPLSLPLTMPVPLPLMPILLLPLRRRLLSISPIPLPLSPVFAISLTM
jgi:hypothetical protein